jgi:hypothetical protein
VNSYGVAVGTSGQWSSRVVVDLARGDAAWHIPNLQPVLRYARSADEALEMRRQLRKIAAHSIDTLARGTWPAAAVAKSVCTICCAS